MTHQQTHTDYVAHTGFPLGEAVGNDIYKTADGLIRAVPHLPEPETAIGTLVEGKGIYAGRWEPTDEHGISLKKVFDVYAAPEDLTDKRGQRIQTKFSKATKAVAKLKNFYGRDGAGLKDDKAILQAVRETNTEKLGKWWIPTEEILRNIWQHKDVGLFKDLCREGYTTAYWSSSVNPKENSVNDFEFGQDDDFMAENMMTNNKNDPNLTRAVRAELIADYNL
jgi:hypothetical protein